MGHGDFLRFRHCFGNASGVPRFVFGVAELLQIAFLAFGFAGDAYLTAVMD